MKHVSILVPMGHSSLPNIDGTMQILNEVNVFAKSMNMDPIFEVELVGLSHTIDQREGLYRVQPNKLISEISQTDLIIIPAMHGNFEKALSLNKDFIPWIKQQYYGGAEVAAFCIASFFLAETGLLDGKKAATHWASASEFKARYPHIELVDEKILTAGDGIYTSGGAYSFLNLLIYLIEKYAGREMAIVVAKCFLIDFDRNSQSPFIIFQGQKSHEDEPIKEAQAFIESNFSEKLTVGDLAKKFDMGRRNLERRFKKATSNTVLEYMQRVKIEVAKKNFETCSKTVSEVMYEVGYSDTKAFREVFKKIAGMSPVDYKQKYNKALLIA